MLKSIFERSDPAPSTNLIIDFFSSGKLITKNQNGPASRIECLKAYDGRGLFTFQNSLIGSVATDFMR